MLHHILLATRNEDKRRELSVMLGDEVIIHHPDEFSDQEVEETEDSLWGNALLKARHGFKSSGLPSVADDTGLEVDALNGEPGVYSSRYAGINATYNDNVNKLLKELKAFLEKERTTRFRTVIAYVDEHGEQRFDGLVEGTITMDKHGASGFGYDPVFKPDGYTITMAEMSLSTKNKISHRGKAFRAFVEWWQNKNNTD
ncbi:MAG: RdgB/HAM1 family non-canonical purine NTP pyrophosphatase [Candidatus Electryonea clarkiae]|nr:RdgB/HAM1 family non-canonical purine NTP pyrophosphatase [Candidatus Electryonea clarkiae]MDP8288659.1 RdgB/HAM1 family non-canonical purine NTP pyrophosphatase [Candidatus Electryonea clarkiae]